MRRFFFIFLFALTALFFTACSSSDDDDNGGGGSTLSYPDPKGIGITVSYRDTSIYKTFEVDQTALNDYKGRLEGDGWTCSTTGTDTDCETKVTVSEASYDLEVNLYELGGDYYITRSIYSTSAESLPSDSIFESEFPSVAGTLSKYGDDYYITFDDGTSRSTYLTAYKKALTDNGFTLEAGSLSRYTKTTGGTLIGVFVEVEDEPSAGIIGLDIGVDITIIG
jgi:hypothetical protein